MKTRLWLIVAIVAAASVATVLSAGNAEAEKKKRAKYKLKFGTMAPSGTPWEEALKEWEKNVEARTNGDIDVQLFLAGALGGELQMVEGVQFGTIEAGGFSTGSISRSARRKETSRSSRSRSCR